MTKILVAYLRFERRQELSESSMLTITSIGNNCVICAIISGPILTGRCGTCTQALTESSYRAITQN